MSNPKYDDLTDQPMPSPTWKPEPKEMDMEPQPLPDQAAESGTDEPPARSGQTTKKEKSAEGAGSDNPTHHTGRVPPKVTDGEL